jgi:hypothetical protein
VETEVHSGERNKRFTTSQTIREKGNATMPRSLETHHHVEGLTGEAVARAHAKVLEVQKKYGLRYLRSWYDEGTARALCLCEAPDKAAVEAVHREAHGLLVDEITEIQEGA